ncbi:hypothetical protein SAMN05444422_11253 [Halobiforma haloterrestris]|uniref:Halobacterial output domain-containing protein n=1 Tax=Natronobacterium haloterrestre TaxID=148448 RepID=A0A1I1KVH4_NATHA|nr:HalOD1 output domain-containing protein [Halobiforma haloterrestris]SFC62123.1 hypothetical protein SAMN05444422_11253 [Halobiforma haloterrestris]
MVTNDCDRSPDEPLLRTERRESESILQTLVRAIAAAEGVPAAELEALYESVDAGALAELLEHADRRGTEVRVGFTVGEYDVVASLEETMTVHVYDGQ